MRSEYKTLATVFPNVYVFPYLVDSERRENAVIDYDRPRSIILIAVNGGASWDTNSIVTTAAQLYNTAIVRTPTFNQDAYQFYELELPTSDVPLLTDDYAPVDTMVF